MKAIYWVAIASWLVSAALAFRLWRGADSVVLKAGLSLVLSIPVLGPLFHVWIQGFPSSLPIEMRDHSGYSTDVLDRWRAYLEQRKILRPLRRTGQNEKNS